MARREWRVATGTRFLSLYVALIMLFAGVYVLIRGDFQHTTVRMEPSYLKERRELRKALESCLSDTLRFVDVVLPSGKVRIPGYMRFDDLGISPEGRLRFTVSVHVLHMKAPERYVESGLFEVLLPVDWPVEARKELRRVGIEYRTMSHSFPVWVRRLSGPPVPEGAVASLLGCKGSGVSELGWTCVPEPLYARMVAFRKATEGNPSDIPGSMGRMLYLSVVTVNTLGYGDILPLTGRARFFTGLESFLGIVVLGLFVSSAARGRRGDKGQS
jgi:hypothetical protein